MQYQILHITRFSYELPVVTSHQLLRLTPRTYATQTCIESHIELSQPSDPLDQRVDAFGNTVHVAYLQREHTELAITQRSRVDVHPGESILVDLSPPWESVVAELNDPGDPAGWDAARYCYASPNVQIDEASAWVTSIVHPDVPLLRACQTLMEYIYREFEYQGGVTDIYTPVAEVVRARNGVCQDFAHVAIAALRSLGLAARYVSGYVLAEDAAGQPLLGGAASHAWFSVWCPKFGWLDFDPTNNNMPRHEHIVLGWGRDYSDVNPTRGYILGGGEQKLAVEVTVLPV